MQLFTTTDANVELIGTGGWLRRLTLSLVGPAAVRTIREHFADKLFLSVKGIARDGSLTDPDPLECEVKRAMIERAEESILLLEPEKLQNRRFAPDRRLRGAVAGARGRSVQGPDARG